MTQPELSASDESQREEMENVPINEANGHTITRYSLQDLITLRDSASELKTDVPNVETEQVGAAQAEDSKSDNGSNDLDQAVDNPDPREIDEKPTKKKKKKKKSKSAKNRPPPPSGFEEFYADPPTTLDEYNEELHDIYHHSKPFVEKIEQCIQRYRARRKLDERRANVFSKYLALGGIETGPKSFTGGLDEGLLENLTAPEIAAAQASDHIRSGIKNKKFYDPSDTSGWVVDFEGLVKGFLSCRAPRLFGTSSEKEISEYCGVIRNFLNYVLSHSVCPEYTNDVLAARKVCDLAEKELWAMELLRPLLPGQFNKAASTLYGGFHHGVATERSWADDSDLTSATGAALTKADAHRIFVTGVSWVGEKHHFERLRQRENPPQVVKEEFRCMEVVAITPPDEEIQMAFENTKDIHGSAGNIKPLGFLEVKDWVNPEALEEDLSNEEKSDDKNNHNNGLLKKDVFWVEEDVLDHCFIGMKFEAVVRELDTGVRYFDSVSGIYCSFFTFLPNELMSDWKEPVPNPRPAPSVDNPERLEVYAEGNDGDVF